MNAHQTAHSMVNKISSSFSLFKRSEEKRESVPERQKAYSYCIVLFIYLTNRDKPTCCITNKNKDIRLIARRRRTQVEEATQ
ncbi:hypothetical protein PSENEW3_00001278 [Picochlorum sp. SENEW3]|nr:hypothetical protein PSENEW3_00001278 [Picochlorum sp. SENEW3]